MSTESHISSSSLIFSNPNILVNFITAKQKHEKRKLSNIESDSDGMYIFDQLNSYIC